MDTIIYDLEGIIIDTEDIWSNSHDMFIKSLGLVKVDSDSKELIAGKTLIEGTRLIKTKYSIDYSISELISLRRKFFIEAVNSFGVSFINGFMDFQKTIKMKQIKTCIATSMEKELFDHLDISNQLYKEFDNKIFFVSKQKLNSKPCPDIFLFAARCLNSAPMDCIVIEDSPIGIKAAKLAQMKCIALSHTFEHYILNEADWIYKGFIDINIDSIINNTK